MIADGLALKAIAFTLVGDPNLEARCALKTNGLLVNGKKLTRHPHAARLRVQLIEKSLNLPQQIRPLAILGVLTKVRQGKVPPKVFPTTSAAYPVSLPMTNVLIHCTCELVVAKERLHLLPLKPELKLGLWTSRTSSHS